MDTIGILALVTFLLCICLAFSMYKKWIPRNTAIAKTLTCGALIFLLLIFLSAPAVVFKFMGAISLVLVFGFLLYLVISAPEGDMKQLFRNRLE